MTTVLQPAETNQSPCESHTVGWKEAMKRAIRSQAELRRELGIPADPDASAAEQFPTFVPREMLSRIRRGDPNDPILRQLLATREELTESPDFVSDPVGDLEASVGGGLIHKYSGRALLITHGACAVHCRYCFRREFPYTSVASVSEKWKTALQHLRDDESIHEVLLSGGDPLTLADQTFEHLLDQIESISHIRRLRLHSRLPIAIPQRLTDRLVDRLSSLRPICWFVIHCNHAAEIDDAVAAGISKLRRAGIPVLNQSVLLAGVNDDVDALAELSEALIDLGVQPYYLHQLDQVSGASHFRVEPEVGRSIVNELRSRLPGYAVPTYVVETAGEKSKTPML
ncbi:MAG: EF-P beta-lysylation protein EpmB [Planctomycetota bacterium]